MKPYLFAVLRRDGSSYTNTVMLTHEQWIKLSDALAIFQEEGKIRWGIVHLLGEPITKTALLRDLYIHALDVEL